MGNADGRAMLLSGDATHVGIGVAFGKDGAGRDGTVLTVLVGTPPGVPASAPAADGAPAPPSPVPPHHVPATMLEGARISGSPAIVPSDRTKTAILESGRTKLVGTFKLCLTPEGAVSGVAMLKTTGFPAYDTKIMREMKEWRYRPYLLDGQPVPVCTAVTFVYSQR
jgi:protein TonB